MMFYVRVSLFVLILVGLSSLAKFAHGQTSPPLSGFVYAGGVLESAAYTQESPFIPAGKQYQFKRTEQVLSFAASPEIATAAIIDAVLIDAYGADANSWAYGHTTLVQNHGPGLANGDYVRVQGGSGPNIAHKTAVSCDAAQWGCWAEQINLGAGAKAALWIGGDNPTLYGRTRDSAPYVIVVNDNLHVTGTVLQWNAQPGDGAFLRIYRGTSLVFEVTSDGVVRAKRFEALP